MDLPTPTAERRDPSGGAVDFWQVDSRFRRRWGYQAKTVKTSEWEGEQYLVPVLCPDCHEFIEYDEHGWPHCPACNSIFPRPHVHTAAHEKRRKAAADRRMKAWARTLHGLRDTEDI